MKHINLQSVIEAYRNLESSLFQKLMNSYGIIVGGLNGIKDYELDGIEGLINNIFKHTADITVTSNYYLGYSIPQIGKEFDLLRFGTNDLVNIEIKTKSSPEKILKQQVKNKYYLSFLEKETHIYTYVLNENKLYKLMIDKSGPITREIDFHELCDDLSSQKIMYLNHIDEVFEPSNYLISPFNSTDRFINEEYFLTIQQEEICKAIQKQLADKTTNFIALTGGAGTGKTLLTYHIAKKAIQVGHEVLILHCAQLNAGHELLKNKYKWHIHMPRYAPSFSDYDLVIIDEAQRMRPEQFNKYTEEIGTLNIKCIFSYDEKQYLSDNEKEYNLKKRIEEELSCTPYILTNKIRTNKEIAFFIKQLFDSQTNIPGITYPHIELTYCKDYFSAKILLQTLLNEGWEIPSYTPGTRSIFDYEKYFPSNKMCAHSVIGQEFNNVAIVIDEHFKYTKNGKLTASNQYYSQRQMLYQIITRARKRLHIIVVNNASMLARCIEILNK